MVRRRSSRWRTRRGRGGGGGSPLRCASSLYGSAWGSESYLFCLVIGSCAIIRYSLQRYLFSFFYYMWLGIGESTNDRITFLRRFFLRFS